MTVNELAKRVEKLEQEVAELQAMLTAQKHPSHPSDRKEGKTPLFALWLVVRLL